MAASDVLVTDHSTVGFEYCLLDRPIVLFEDAGFGSGRARQSRTGRPASLAWLALCLATRCRARRRETKSLNPLGCRRRDDNLPRACSTRLAPRRHGRWRSCTICCNSQRLPLRRSLARRRQPYPETASCGVCVFSDWIRLVDGKDTPLNTRTYRQCLFWGDSALPEGDKKLSRRLQSRSVGRKGSGRRSAEL